MIWIQAVTVSYDYDAFGNKINSTGSTPNNYLYRGEQYDSDLGLYYLRARYYNPLTGRFLSVDSQAGAGQRRYEYAEADPIDSMDPSGNEAIVEFALLQFYPKRLPVHFPGLPSWCGFAGAESLPECGGTGGPVGSGGNGAGPGGPPDNPPCEGPNCKLYWITISYWPLGAKVIGGHIGVAVGDSPGVKNEDTHGWAPGWEFWNPEPSGAQKFKLSWLQHKDIHPGVLRDDAGTYKGWRSPHIDLHFKVNMQQASQAMDAYNERMSESRTPQSFYNLYTRNCGQFAEDVLHAAEVPGVPGHAVVWPRVLFPILAADAAAQ
jgi:RHS repeat-associated protein